MSCILLILTFSEEDPVIQVILEAQIGKPAAVVAQRQGLGHHDQFTQLELHPVIAINERSENFCVEFNYFSNNVPQFFSFGHLKI